MTPGSDTLAAQLGDYSQAVLVGSVMQLVTVAVRRAVAARRRPIPVEQT